MCLGVLGYIAVFVTVAFLVWYHGQNERYSLADLSQCPLAIVSVCNIWNQRYANSVIVSQNCPEIAMNIGKILPHVLVSNLLVGCDSIACQILEDGKWDIYLVFSLCFCSMSFPHRLYAVMGSSCVQFLAMQPTTAIRIGKHHEVHVFQNKGRC